MRSAGSGVCEAEVLDGGGENDPQEEVPGPQDPGPQVNRHSASASLWTELQASKATLLPAPREAAGPLTKPRPGAWGNEVPEQKLAAWRTARHAVYEHRAPA